MHDNQTRIAMYDATVDFQLRPNHDWLLFRLTEMAGCREKNNNKAIKQLF